MTAQAALKSRDIAEVKKGRAVIKGQLTTAASKLSVIFSKKEEDDFDHKRISKTEVNQLKSKMKENFEIFQKLHEKCCELRDSGKDDTEEEDNAKKDEEYSNEVTSKVYPLLDQLVEYERSVEDLEAKKAAKKIEKDAEDTLVLEERKAKDALTKSIPEREKKYQEALENFQISKESALQIVKCLENLEPDDIFESSLVQIQPADSAKESLSKDFRNLVSSASELKAAMEARGDEVTAIEQQLKFDRSEELRRVGKINIDLNTILEAKKINSEKNKSTFSNPVLSSTFKDPSPSSKASPIKLNKPDPIKFSGQPKDFATFKRDFEVIIVPNRSAADVGLYLKQAIPAKDLHLLANVDLEKHGDMMDILAQEFGTTRQVVDSVITEIEKLKLVTTDRMFIDFVEKLERIHRDLTTVKMIEEVANATVIGKLESKLPVVVNQEWTRAVIKEKYDKKLSKEKYEYFMKFLAEQKEMVKYHMSDARSSVGHKTQTQTSFVTGLSSKVNIKPDYNRSASASKPSEPKYVMKPCIACDDGATNIESIKHSVETCDVWNSLVVKEKEAKVKCRKHPFSQDHNNTECKSIIRGCRICKEKSHHTLLCPKRKVKTSTAKNSVTAKTRMSTSLETPVIVHAMFVKTLKGMFGTLLDNCSTDHYITNDMARKHKLRGEEVELLVEGIGGESTKVDSKIYQVPIKDKFGTLHTIECYGMDVIATPAKPPEAASYSELCDKFGVSPEEVKRPQKIDLLISMRDNYLLADSKLKTIDKMALYDGPLGKVFGGLDPNLKFGQDFKMSFKSTKQIISEVSSHTMRAVLREVTRTHTAKTDKEFLDFFREESIGAECSPKCGSCLCGKCPLGGKQMSLKDEKDYNLFVDHMRHDKEGTEIDPGPYWRVSFPWVISKEEMVVNKSAVLGVMNATAKKLGKDPKWREVYETQLKDLVSRGFAREVEEEEIIKKRGKGQTIYFIAHQMALNPGSKTTPVRTVFNCSQMYRGHSLNSSLALGPENGLNSLHAILLRFREDEVAAQGDITKQYYMLRIEPEEEMMQLWVWRFAGEERIRTFCMMRLGMGLKPSANFAIIAMKETSKLEDFEEKYPVAKRALSEDSYVDNTFVTGKTVEEVKGKIEEINFVASHGGFKYKEWVISRENVPQQVINIHLPHAIGVDEEKALGVFWDVYEDELYFKVEISAGGKKTAKKIDLMPYLGIDPSKSSPSHLPPLTLTIRICLSIHAKTHDPLGFVFPVKMIGTLLFRETLQGMNQELYRDKHQIPKTKRIPWDSEIDQEFKDRWLEYFRILDSLKEIKFARSMKPKNSDPKVDPTLVTFSDGNPDAYGTVAYGIWTLLDGSREVTLIMSKAKLGPLQYKGETTRNELAGATFAARVKCWIMENTGLQFGDHVPFLDSRIVQDMIKKDSYGYNTFVGLRVAEIQQKTDVDAWRHIPSAENIADILTKGAKPDKLGPGSIWQCGPEWVVKDESEWPVTNVVRLTEVERNDVQKFAKSPKKVSTFAVTIDVEQHSEIDLLIARCGKLGKLIRSTAYVLRLLGRTPPPRSGENLTNGMIIHFIKSGERISIGDVISAAEYNDAWMFLISWEQQKLDIRKQTGLKVTKIEKELSDSRKLTQIILCPRIKNFPISFSANQFIPILPCGALAKLIAEYYHNKYHTDIESVVAHIRNEVWIIKIRKLVSGIDKKCKLCLIKRKKMAAQMMGELPEFRFRPSSAFSAVCMDLFGPMIIRDDCVKKGPRVTKKVWGVLFTCTASRAVYLDIAIDYSTEAVLHTIRRLMAFRGDVRIIISDPGSQLVGASKELVEWRKGWDQEELNRFGASKGIEWNFIMPASQHQNGAAESLVKFSKGVLKSMMKTYADFKLSLNELNTLFAEAANVTNERPIGIKPNSQTDTEYMSPNSLLLGRNSSRINSGPFQNRDVYDEKLSSMKTRFLLVQWICNQFWKVWTKLYFPTLLWQQKWHHQKRNLQVGDVCVLQDPNAYRGEWRLCTVTEAYPDKNGVVRNVEIKVAPRFGGSSTTKYKPQSLYKLKRHVSKLIVIVPVDGNNEVQSIDQHALFQEEINLKDSENEEDVNRSKLESSESGPNC